MRCPRSKGGMPVLCISACSLWTRHVDHVDAKGFQLLLSSAFFCDLVAVTGCTQGLPNRHCMEPILWRARPVRLWQGCNLVTFVCLYTFEARRATLAHPHTDSEGVLVVSPSCLDLHITHLPDHCKSISKVPSILSRGIIKPHCLPLSLCICIADS